MKWMTLLRAMMNGFQSKWRAMKKNEPAVAALSEGIKADRTFEQDLQERAVRAQEKLARAAMETLRLEQAKVSVTPCMRQ